MPGRVKRAVTLRELRGVASGKAGFIRSDARAVVAPSASKSRLKLALSLSSEPTWSVASDADTARVLQRIATDCVDAEVGSARARPGVIIGLRAVTRRLGRRSLRAVFVARNMRPSVLVAHLPVLARRHAVLCALDCTSAQLGQPFGLLRAAAVGLSAEAFAADHPLVELASTLQLADGPSEAAGRPDAGAAAQDEPRKSPRFTPRAARLPDVVSPALPVDP